MEPVAVVGCHPAPIDCGANRLLAIQLFAKMGSERDSRFGSRDRRVRRCVKVRAERVHAANRRELYRRERRVIDRQIVEPHQRHAGSRKVRLEAYGRRAAPRSQSRVTRACPPLRQPSTRSDAGGTRHWSGESLRCSCPAGRKFTGCLRQQGRHRDLKRLRHHHAAAFIRAAGMDVHHVEADADRIVEPSRARAGPVFIDDVLLDDATFARPCGATRECMGTSRDRRRFP